MYIFLGAPSADVRMFLLLHIRHILNKMLIQIIKALSMAARLRPIVFWGKKTCYDTVSF